MPERHRADAGVRGCYRRLPAERRPTPTLVVGAVNLTLPTIAGTAAPRSTVTVGTIGIAAHHRGQLDYISTHAHVCDRTADDR